MQIEQMPMVRIFFEKLGRARYISHLDTVRTMSRALRRSGLPFWYTQGFNPHLYMTFALPIALGCESLCESMDLRMTRQPAPDIADSLNAVLPPGFRVTKTAPPQMDPGSIAWADYNALLHYEHGNPELILRKWESFMAQPVIEVVKKSKKGEKTIDLRPLVQFLNSGVEQDSLTLSLRLAAGNTVNVSPSLLLNAFYGWSGRTPETARLKRTAILNGAFEPFA